MITTNTTGPYLSIGMPVSNCENTLATAILSILHQSYHNWELLLIDDGSTDSTLQIARTFDDSRIKVVAGGSHTCLAKRLNQAVEMSKGKYFARMDGDDISYPERLEVQVKYLEQHPEVDLLGCGVLVFKGSGHALGTRRVRESHGEICRRPWSGIPLAHPSWMGRIEWFQKNPYRPDLTRTEDQDLLLRTYPTSRFACLPNVLVALREDELSLRKILTGRRNFSMSLLRQALRTGEYLWAMKGIVGQILKAQVDLAAVATGLNYRILKHRALPADEETLDRWNKLWAQLHY